MFSNVFSNIVGHSSQSSATTQPRFAAVRRLALGPESPLDTNTWVLWFGPLSLQTFNVLRLRSKLQGVSARQHIMPLATHRATRTQSCSSGRAAWKHDARKFKTA